MAYFYSTTLYINNLLPYFIYTSRHKLPKFLECTVLRSALYIGCPTAFLNPVFIGTPYILRAVCKVWLVWGGSIVTQFSFTEAVCWAALVATAELVLVHTELALKAAAKYICNTQNTATLHSALPVFSTDHGSTRSVEIESRIFLVSYLIFFCATNSPYQRTKIATSQHPDMSRCWALAFRWGKFVVQQVVELLWACLLVVLYNMSIAGVRVVEFGPFTGWQHDVQQI